MSTGNEFTVTHGRNGQNKTVVKPLSGKDGLRWEINPRKSQSLKFKVKKDVMDYLEDKYDNVEVVE